MARRPVQLAPPVFNKLKRMGFSGQSYNDLVDDLIDFAKENADEWESFLDARYEVEEDE